MINNMRKIENWIQRTHATGILTTLLQSEKIYFSELKNIIGKGSSSTINIALNELKTLGLVDEEVEDKFGGRRYIWLTPKGKQVAEKLKEIEEILKEE